MATIQVQEQEFDAGKVIAALHADNATVGAVATFIGLVRDRNDDQGIHGMVLEHYPGMTEQALAKIVAAAEARWDLLDVTVIHRVGRLAPGAPIVLVAVASMHRGAAFAACEYIMDFLKTRAPFWKKETTAEGERWVSARDSDAQAVGRWRD